MTIQDHVIRVLADNEADLLDRVVDLTTERDAYRLMVQQLLRALSDAVKDRDRLREQQRHLREELRRYTAQVIDRKAA